MQKGKQEDPNQPFKCNNDTFDELVETIKTQIEDYYVILSDWGRAVRLGPFHSELEQICVNEAQKSLRCNSDIPSYLQIITKEFTEITDTLEISSYVNLWWEFSLGIKLFKPLRLHGHLGLTLYFHFT